MQVSADMPSQITSEQRCLARNTTFHFCSEAAELERLNKESITVDSDETCPPDRKRIFTEYMLLFSPVRSLVLCRMVVQHRVCRKAGVPLQFAA